MSKKKNPAAVELGRGAERPRLESALGNSVRPRPAKPLKPVGPKNRGTGARAPSPRQENPCDYGTTLVALSSGATPRKQVAAISKTLSRTAIRRHQRRRPFDVVCTLAPNPVLSLKYFRAVSSSMASGKPRDAIKQVIALYRRNFLTFRGSGWVTTVAGRLVLDDETTSKEFVKLYWREARKPPPKSRISALEALGLTQGDHRKHWLAATRWMRDSTVDVVNRGKLVGDLSAVP